MPEPQKLDPKVATLIGGPANRQVLHLQGTTTWREYVCVELEQPGADLKHHYLLISAGVYEYGGACIEFEHSNLPAVDRCPDCGCPLDSPHPRADQVG